MLGVLGTIGGIILFILGYFVWKFFKDKGWL